MTSFFEGFLLLGFDAERDRVSRFAEAIDCHSFKRLYAFSFISIKRWPTSCSIRLKASLFVCFFLHDANRHFFLLLLNFFSFFIFKIIFWLWEIEVTRIQKYWYRVSNLSSFFFIYSKRFIYLFLVNYSSDDEWFAVVSKINEAFYFFIVYNIIIKMYFFCS